MFQTNLSLEEICSWFIAEMAKLGFKLDGEIIQSKYEHSFSVAQNKQQLSFSIFSSPSPETNICIFVKPKLRFFEALRRKNDVSRELATTHTHAILSDSNHLCNLGWYTDTNVWRGSTNAP